VVKTAAQKQWAAEVAQAEREKHELRFVGQCAAVGLPALDREYIVPNDEFLSNKPFDFHIPGTMALIEIDGGTWLKTGYGRSGGHAHPLRIAEDNAKRNRARLLGWTVFQFTGDQVESGEALRVVERVLKKA
jgi:very-short-patch-repair endonuclease